MLNERCDDSFPDVIRIEASGLCNFRCRHCPTGLIANNRANLTRENFLKIIDQFSAKNFIPRVVVLYHGGEPLINKNLEDFIRLLKEYGVKKTVITTNGSLLTEVRSRRLIEAGLDELKVSFDGESAKENDYIRKNGKFSNNAKNVKSFLKIRGELKRKNPTVKLCNVRICNKATLDELNQKGKFLFTQLPEYLTKYYHDELSEVETQSYPAMVWPGYNNCKNIKIVKYLREKPAFCSNLFETTTIMANGDVVPCCYDLAGEVVFGNVFTTNLFDIWENRGFMAFRQNFKNKKYPSLCNKCAVLTPRYLCRG